MQAILAIIQAQDTNVALDRLKTLNLPALMPISSAGGFLRQGNTALWIGVQPSQLNQVIEILRETCHQRTNFMPTYYLEAPPNLTAFPIEVEVGGATLFICDVEHFEVY